MKQILFGFILLFCYELIQSQTIFNPNDPIINYDSTAIAGSASNPNIPFGNNIVKWVRTPKMFWNTDRYKCYLIGNTPFRLRYPDSYVPGVNDGKKYPIMLFFHGGGEANINTRDNEFQLLNGGLTFQDKIFYGGQDAFIIFPQSKSVGWDNSYFIPMNIVIDSLIKNCKGDEDRVVSMGLSIGGSAAMDYAIAYPQRASTIIPNSPVFLSSYNTALGPAIHVPLWMGSGGKDVNPDPGSVQNFVNAYNTTGGDLYWSFYPNQGHVMWDYQWAEEPNFGDRMRTTHKANPLVFFNNRFFCPGSPVSSRMGITGGFFAYQWDKNGVVIPGATSNEYIATDFGVYRARFKRTSIANWSAWSLAPAIISPVCPPVNGTGTGLTGTYYNNIDFTPPSSVTRIDPAINFVYDFNTSPVSPVGVDHYSIKWTGKIQPQFSETYTIYTKSDDGIRLWINGVQLINNFTDHATTEDVGTIALIAGQKYDIKIEYFDRNGGGVATLKWSSPSTVKQMVPAKQLYPDGTGDTDIPLCTTNISPANGAVTAANTTATLSWNSVFNATSYDVYIWTGATPPASPVSNVSTNTYNATGLVSSTLYNWYVVPKNTLGPATGCNTTSKWSFTTNGGVPACATNSLPANGSTIAAATTATLSWGSVSNATSYDIYLWTGTTAPALPTANVTTTTYSAIGLTASTLYSWYVVPKNASGNASGCGSTNKTTFTTSASTTGSGTGLQGTYYNNITLTGTPVVVRIDPVINFDFVYMAAAPGVNLENYSVRWTGQVKPLYSETYTFYAVTDDGVRLWVNGVQLINNWVNQGATEKSGILTLVAGQKYDIVMEYYQGTGYAVSKLLWSGASTPKAIIPQSQLFPPGFTDPTIPTCATNSSPVNGSTIAAAGTATLVWNTVADATSYDVFIWTGATPAAIPIANVTTATYTATGLTASTQYTWYVVPKNAVGAPSGCISNSTSFTTGIPVPPCTSNLLPANNAILATANTATLTWTAATTASSYDVYIWTGATAPAIPTVNVATTTYNATGLTAAATYNWFIVPKNASGSATGCSTNKTAFVTASAPAPSCTTNTSPANGSTILTSTTAVLSWSAALNATSYDVYVWTGATAPTSPTANVTTTTYNAAALTAATLYNWYVVPRNATGTATGCSTNKTTFTTANAPDGSGLQGVYYNNITLTGTPVVTRIDPVINFDFVYMAAAPGVNLENYSVRWTGQVKPLYSETYTFYAVTDDGVRLWVNGVQLINNWVNQGATEKSGAITLVAGQKYDIVMEYFQGTGYAVSKLLWSGASTPKAIIPQSQLYPPVGMGARVMDAAMQAVPSSQASVSSSLPSITSTVSPNPVTPGQFAKLQINSDKAGTAIINIINSIGLIISTQKVKLTAGMNTTTVNTSSLSRGLYIIIITGNYKPLNIKLLVE